MNKKEPLVSICCITYNHEPYIRDAIEGFLMQKTDFPFEILIHDDASTDGTADIIQEYEAKYPDIIKPIYQTENQYSKGKKISATYNYPRTKGKYIALCEGDDYWIDPYKLQKQVDFLEANPEYGLVHTNVKIFRQIENKFYETNDELLNRKLSDIDLKERILAGDYIIRTCSVVMKKDLLKKIISSDDFLFQSRYFLMGDTPLWVEFANASKICFLNDVTGVYRINHGSVTKSKSTKKRLRFILSMYELRMYFCNKYNFSKRFNDQIKNAYQNSLQNYQFYEPNFHPLYPIDRESNKLSLKAFFLKGKCRRFSYRLYLEITHKLRHTIGEIYRNIITPKS